MMIRHSEMEAKKRSMKRLSDPQTDISGASDREEKEEVEARREIDQVGTSQRDSVGTVPESTRIKRPGPNP
jgi:hypothetical protein